MANFNFKLPKTAHSHLRKDIKIPRKPTKELARVFGDLLGDGHLQIDHGLVSFYSKDMDEIKKEEARFFQLFGIKGLIYKKRKKEADFSLFFCSKTLSQFFYHLGMPNGNKTDQKFLIPGWILDGTDKIKSAFVSGFYDAEGSIYSSIWNNKVRWRLYINQHKKESIKESGLNFMNQIKQLLSSFNITTSPTRIQKARSRKDGTKIIRLYFEIKKDSINKFYKYVGFKNPYKQKRLVISSRPDAQAVKGTDIIKNSPTCSPLVDSG